MATKRKSAAAALQSKKFKRGFLVSINFLYHHLPPAKRAEFKAFLVTPQPADGSPGGAGIDEATVTKAINIKSKKTLTSGEQCPPGECPVNNQCRLCLFSFALDSNNFPDFSV